jgi:hypothetical protein
VLYRLNEHRSRPRNRRSSRAAIAEDIFKERRAHVPVEAPHVGAPALGDIHPQVFVPQERLDGVGHRVYVADRAHERVLPSIAYSSDPPLSLVTSAHPHAMASTAQNPKPYRNLELTNTGLPL